MSETITKTAFKGTVGASYRVMLASGSSIELNLVQVRELPSNPGYETFALDFRGPLETRLLQQTYTMKHSSLGELEIFIVPVGVDDKSFYYEAVFNRRMNQE